MSAFVSYAQNFEDVVLWRALSDVQNGCYIDIGANDPVLDSVSRSFYEAGWRGVHVEPVRFYADRLRADRPEEIIIEAAVSSSKSEISLYDFPGTGLSTVKQEVAERHISEHREHARITVPTISLKKVMERASRPDIHWLKIDVEGAEADVLESWADGDARPWIVVVEATLPNSQIASFADWEPKLTERGYAYVHFDGLNRFYVHSSKKKLASKIVMPPNYHDKFAISEHSPFVVALRGDRIRAEQRAASTEESNRHFVAEVGRLQGLVSAQHDDNQKLAQQSADAERRLNEAMTALKIQAETAQQTLGALASSHQQAVAALEKNAQDTLREAQLAAEAKLRGLNSECEALNTKLREIATQRDALEGTLRRSKSESEALTAKLAEASGVRDIFIKRQAELEAQVARLGIQLSDTRLRSADLEIAVAAMRTSMSWRVSAPVRLIGNLARAATRASLAFARSMARRVPFLKRLALKAIQQRPGLRRKIEQLSLTTPAPPSGASLGFHASASAHPTSQHDALRAPLVTQDESYSVRLLYCNVAKASPLRIDL